MRHKKDKSILVSTWIISLLLWLLFVPREKFREAQVSFLFKHIITWLFGLLVVKFNLIEYPVRFFKRVNKTSFTFEYMVYPTLCALFNLYYPDRKNNFIKGLYYILHSSLITVFEVYAVKYTKLIRYKNGWKWYWSFTTIMLTYYVSRLYHKWFFKEKAKN
ncbi:CBO0543 family protein [Cytobacillus sp. S13-E01]|uniref:CBO0543 family protein n=1 Tax=Cytobacillus sp. S13-E01 TaxID=3031326 RepID=UPI0031F32AA5